MTSIVSEVEAEVSNFVPHPGSRLAASQNAAAQETGNATVPVDQESGEETFVVQTRTEMPEETIPRTLTLGPNNPYLPVLPRDMKRRRAVVLAVDNDVVLCESKELAQTVAGLVSGGAAATSLANGFYLPKGTPLPIESRDWMFAVVTTTSGNSRVSVVVERYAD